MEGGVEIAVWGRRLSSPAPELRELYVYASPARGSAAESLFYAAQRVLTHLSALSTSSADPWWLHRKCEHCEVASRRYFNDPRIPIHHAYDKWRTGYCMRHGVLMHNDLFSISGRRRVLSLSGGALSLKTSTNKYSAEFTVYRDRADAVIVRGGGRQWSFTYPNHSNGGLYASAYQFLVRRIRELLLSLVDAVMSCRYYNTYVNGRLVCPPETFKNPGSPHL